MSAPAEKSAMSTPSKASGVASPTSSRPAGDRQHPPGRAARGEQPQLADGEVPLGEDLDHRPTDDAGGADDRDGERARRLIRAWLRGAVDDQAGTAEYSSGAPPATRPERPAPIERRRRLESKTRRRRRAPSLARPRLEAAGDQAGILGQVALHRRLAGQVDPALAVDLDDDHHDLVADGHDVLDGRHVVVGELADADEAFLARQDLDEGAEAHDPGDLAEVEGADLDLAGQALDPLDRLARVLAD